MIPACPRCGSDATRIVAPAGTLARWLRLLSVVPFRCQLCAWRFHRFSFHPAVHPLPGEKREYVRLPTRFHAVVGGTNGPSPAVIVDLTVAGCALQTTSPMTKGAFVNLHLAPFEEEQAPIKVETAIVRSRRPDAMGVQFLELSAGDTRRLREYVQELLMRPTPASI